MNRKFQPQDANSIYIVSMHITEQTLTLLAIKK